jgi:hypothetical protein
VRTHPDRIDPFGERRNKLFVNRALNQHTATGRTCLPGILYDGAHDYRQCTRVPTSGEPVKDRKSIPP